MTHRSGDVLAADLGSPQGSEAGVRRPVVIVTAQVVLTHQPKVVQVVPLTTTVRNIGPSALAQMRDVLADLLDI